MGRRTRSLSGLNPVTFNVTRDAHTSIVVSERIYRERVSGNISNSVFDLQFSDKDKDKDETTKAKRRAKTKEERENTERARERERKKDLSLLVVIYLTRAVHHLKTHPKSLFSFFLAREERGKILKTRKAILETFWKEKSTVMIQQTGEE